MTMLERLNYLKERSGKAGTTICEEAGVTKGALSDWNCGRSKPSLDAIIKLAAYFDVSIDYLVYGDTNSQKTVNHDCESETDTVKEYDYILQEDILLNIYKKLPESSKNMLIAYANGLSDALSLNNDTEVDTRHVV